MVCPVLSLCPTQHQQIQPWKALRCQPCCQWRYGQQQVLPVAKERKAVKQWLLVLLVQVLSVQVTGLSQQQ